MHNTELVKFADNRLTLVFCTIHSKECSGNLYLYVRLSVSSPLTVVHDTGPYVGTELLEAISPSYDTH